MEDVLTMCLLEQNMPSVGRKRSCPKTKESVSEGRDHYIAFRRNP